MYGRDQNATPKLLKTVSGGTESWTDTGSAVGSLLPSEPFPMRRIASNIPGEAGTNGTRRWVDTGVSAAAGELPEGVSELLSTTVASDDVESAPAGRIERNIGDSDLLLASTVFERSYGYLKASAIIEPSYTLTLKLGAWNGPDDLWLGDNPLLDIVSGRLDISRRDLRVTEMQFDIQDDGSELVTVVLGSRPPSVFERIRRVNARLDTLDRR